MVAETGNLNKVKRITGPQCFSGYFPYVKINEPLSIKRSLVSMVGKKKKRKHIFGSIYVI